jgi:hypothetical protein
MVANFRRVFDDDISDTTIVDAIATFERALVTSNSRFDPDGSPQVFRQSRTKNKKMVKRRD